MGSIPTACKGWYRHMNSFIENNRIDDLRQNARDFEIELSIADSALRYDDLQTLPAAEKFIEQQADIRDLLRSYKALLLKDLNDLSNMIQSAEDMDDAIASSHGI